MKEPSYIHDISIQNEAFLIPQAKGLSLSALAWNAVTIQNTADSRFHLLSEVIKQLHRVPEGLKFWILLRVITPGNSKVKKRLAEIEAAQRRERFSRIGEQLPDVFFSQEENTITFSALTVNKKHLSEILALDKAYKENFHLLITTSSSDEIKKIQISGWKKENNVNGFIPVPLLNFVATTPSLLLESWGAFDDGEVVTALIGQGTLITEWKTRLFR